MRAEEKGEMSNSGYSGMDGQRMTPNAGGGR